MNKTMLIPDNLEIGFQKRSDTMENRLSYITYKKDNGTIAKEKSWNDWKSDDIPVEQYKNIPTSGFIISKDIKDHTWSGNTRVKMRVYDPRGYDFEISINNLFMILVNSDINKCEISGDFVYAWDGAELILLPVNSEEYKISKEASETHNKKISVKELKVGALYKSRIIRGKTSSYLYLGRKEWNDSLSYEKLDLYNEKMSTKLNRYALSNLNDDYSVSKKAHVFYDFEYKMYCINVTNKLATCVEEDYEEFHKIDEDFEKTMHSSKIKDFILTDKLQNEKEKSLYFFYPLSQDRYMVVQTKSYNRYFKEKGIDDIYFVYRDRERNLFYYERAFLNFEKRANTPFFKNKMDQDAINSFKALMDQYKIDKEGFISAVKKYNFKYFKDVVGLTKMTNYWLGLIILFDGDSEKLKDFNPERYHHSRLKPMSDVEYEDFFEKNRHPELKQGVWKLENGSEIFVELQHSF